MLELDYYEGEAFLRLDLDPPLLRGKRFVGCTFTCVDFSDLEEISDCVFDSCQLSSAGLNGLRLRGCSFLNCHLRFANLFATIFDRCKMTGSDLGDCDLSTASLLGGDWTYTDLRYLDFDRKHLVEVDFRGADLSGARFYRARLEDCRLEGATLHGTGFRNADLRGSTLNGDDLKTADLTGAKVDLPQCITLAEALGVRYVP